jgi:hypothetical protein
MQTIMLLGTRKKLKSILGASMKAFILKFGRQFCT